MGDGENKSLKNLKVKEKDKIAMKKLSCAEFGMNQEDVFELMMSFCLENNAQLEKWYKKKTKQEK